MKKLSFFLKKNNGRNNQGKIMFRHRGGGHRRRYRMIDLKKFIFSVESIVYQIIYDPNRTAQLGLILYKNGIFSYILGYKGMLLGDILSCGENASLTAGNTLFLKDIPIGTLIYNIELSRGQGGIISRAAGTFSQIINKYVYNNNEVLIRFKSKEEYLIHSLCKATIGTVSNELNYLKFLRKAGQTRWLNKRPIVRGVAMNPVDHPHGGGEGKTSGGRPSVTPYGIITKGKPTRKKNIINFKIIKSRKK